MKVLTVGAFSIISSSTVAMHQTLTQHSLSEASQLFVGVLEGLLHLLVEGLLLALDQDGGAAVQDPLRGALHHQDGLGLAGGGVLMDGELRGVGVEREREREREQDVIELLKTPLLMLAIALMHCFLMTKCIHDCNLTLVHNIT